jgi:hypothetical protein
VNRAAAYEVIRLLPRVTTIGMVVVLVLQVSGVLNHAAGLLDVIVLSVIGIAARMSLRSASTGPPKR